MKSKNIKYAFIATIVITLLTSFTIVAQEFDASNYNMMFNFKTAKQHDNTRLLEVSFIARNNEDSRDEIPVLDAEIKFFNIQNEKEVLIGSVKTAKNGTAKFIVPANYKYLADKDGFINVTAKFEGSDVLSEESEELLFKDLQLQLELTEVEGVRMIKGKAYVLNIAGEELPVEADLYFYAGGMLTKMKIEDGIVEEGALEYEFEYNSDLPGSVDGNITFYLTVEDHDEFGNVTQLKTINWGIPNPQTTESNKLWSEVAPLWMYIVLSILLIGVWANFVYTGINLFIIRKEGKLLEEKSKRR
jgi:hypothetical protein